MNKKEFINFYVDTLDECVMLYYEATRNELYESTSVSNYNVEKPHSNFYECYIKVVNYLLLDMPLDIVSDEVVKNIDDKFLKLVDEMSKVDVKMEDIRSALMLLDIKGFKNLNFSLDIITPDVPALVCAEMVKSLVKKDATMLDFNFGTGNLIFFICAHLDLQLKLVGLDNHELMARVAATKANLLQIDLDIYHEDALNVLPTDVDIIVSDLASYDYENANFSSPLYEKGVRYFPYLAIEHYLNVNKKINAIYLIDNDFFGQSGNNFFKEMLNQKGVITSLIALPTNLFQNAQTARSIIVIKNEPNINKKTEIFTLPNTSDHNNFIDTINKIKASLKENK